MCTAIMMFLALGATCARADASCDSAAASGCEVSALNAAPSLLQVHSHRLGHSRAGDAGESGPTVGCDERDDSQCTSTNGAGGSDCYASCTSHHPYQEPFTCKEGYYIVDMGRAPEFEGTPHAGVSRYECRRKCGGIPESAPGRTIGFDRMECAKEKSGTPTYTVWDVNGTWGHPSLSPYYPAQDQPLAGKPVLDGIRHTHQVKGLIGDESYLSENYTVDNNNILEHFSFSDDYNNISNASHASKLLVQTQQAPLQQQPVVQPQPVVQQQAPLQQQQQQQQQQKPVVQPQAVVQQQQQQAPLAVQQQQQPMPQQQQPVPQQRAVLQQQSMPKHLR